MPAKKPARKPAKKMPPPRVSILAEDKLTPAQRALYDFVQELYKTRRVSDKTYARVRDLLGEAATVEFVGILGYYVLISMILNVFRMSPPEGEPLPFAET